MSHWPTKPLSQLIVIEKGKKAPEAFSVPTRTSVRYLQIEDLRPGTTLKYCEPFNCPKATKSDAIMAWDGANAGTVSCNLIGHIGSTLAVLHPIKADILSPIFLSRFLEGSFDYLQLTATGATVPHISKNALINLQIPMPPLAEQERIVRLLDEADELRKLRTQADNCTAVLIPAIFHEMFNESEARSSDWPIKRLGDLVLPTEQRDPRDNPTDKFSYVDIASVDNKLKVITESKQILGAEAPSRARKVIRKGDVIVSTVRPNLNAVAYVPNHLDNQICSTGFSVLRPSKEVITEYLFAFATSSVFIDFLSAKTVGANYPAVNDGEVKAVPVSLPPLALQKKFAEQVTEIRSIQADQSASRQRLEDLFNSMLHRAFNGEL